MILAAAAVLMLVTPVKTNEAQAKDTSKLVGTWNVTSAEKDGKTQTATDVKGRQVKITRDTITCYDRDNKVEMACNFTIDTSKTPWRVEMKCTQGEHKDKKLQGIVQLDRDTLKLAFSKPDKDAPTNFTARQDQCSYTLERARR
jgi:uncharacterized protein (TIGR03067 family)